MSKKNVQAARQEAIAKAQKEQKEFRFKAGRDKLFLMNCLLLLLICEWCLGVRGCSGKEAATSHRRRHRRRH